MSIRMDHHDLPDGRRVKLGKAPPKHDPRTLRLARYLDPQLLPEPPASLHLTPLVSDWGMMRNSDIGDCTCAAAGHLIELWSAASGKEIKPLDDQVVAMYSAITGYTPSDPSTDQGAVELDVLNWWRKNPLDNQCIFAFVALNPKNLSEVKTAMYLFDGVYIGVALPASAQMQTGKLWDVTNGPEAEPGSWGGHAVPVFDYSDSDLTCITWGKEQRMSVDFWMRYVDECWAVLPALWQTQGPQTDGFKWDDLVRDLGEL